MPAVGYMWMTEPRNARVLDYFRREWGCFRLFAGKHSHHLAQSIRSHRGAGRGGGRVVWRGLGLAPLLPSAWAQ